jgi:receptor protein-tyrosine kinase/non-specific protein-tyrosine kinase
MNSEASQNQILRDVFRVLRRQRWVILITTLVAVAAAIAYSVLKTPEYQATSVLQFVDQTNYLAELGLSVPFTGESPAQQAAQNATRITSPPVVDAVAKDVDSGLSNSQVKDSVTTSVSPDDNLVSVTAQASSAKLSSDLANAYANETKRILTDGQQTRLQQTAKSLENSVDKQPDGSIAKVNAQQNASRLRSIAKVARPVEIVKDATEPGSPASPKPVRDTALALVLGLVFGTLLAFLRDSFDRRLTDPHEVQHELQIPMLGYVEDDALGGVGIARNGSKKNRGPEHGLEPFRILRSNVDFLALDHPIKSLAVTSPVAEEGKSSVAAGLASAAALAGKRVLLVECDLRRPVLAERFRIDASPGLSDWAVGNAAPNEVIQSLPLDRTNGNRGDGQVTAKELQTVDGTPSLTVISAGTFSPRPAELLASRRFKEFVAQVKEVYDLVVFDCTPLLPVGDALEVLPEADAALLCIRLNQTTREQAQAAKAALEHLPERPVGLVLTGVRPGREGYYYGYYSSRPSSAPAMMTPAASGETSGLRRQ